MRQIVMEIAEDSLLALRMKPHEIAAELRLMAAIKLYELGKLSSGAAAVLAGIPRVIFLLRLADYGIDTFRLTEEELQQETSLV